MNSGISEIRLSHTKNIDINVLWTLKGIHPGCNTLDKERWWAIGGTGLLHHLDKYCFMPLSAAHRSCLLLSSVSWSHHHACFAAFQVTVHQCKLQRKQSLFWAETGSLDSRNRSPQKKFVSPSLPSTQQRPTLSALQCLQQHWVHMITKGYEQGRIRTEILFLSIQHSSWLRRDKPLAYKTSTVPTEALKSLCFCWHSHLV